MLCNNNTNAISSHIAMLTPRVTLPTKFWLHPYLRVLLHPFTSTVVCPYNTRGHLYRTGTGSGVYLSHAAFPKVAGAGVVCSSVVAATMLWDSRDERQKPVLVTITFVEKEQAKEAQEQGRSGWLF